jgi:N-acetyl-anhydromuramyl-L-alanine amidase AmpD
MPGVNWIASPNQGVRPNGSNVNSVVVHATVIPSLEKTVYHFLNQGSQVSAHYVVGKDGTVVQMVDDTARAWHAGVSELAGTKNVNDFSVGIEIVNLNDGKDRFTEAQYKAVASIVHHLRQQYFIPDSRIVSHERVALPAGRKNDPKGFSFAHLLKLLQSG